MNKEIKSLIAEYADDNYKKFSSKHLPNINNVLGVRLPILRKIAKDIAKGEWHSVLEENDDEYFEEIMVRGMLIGYAKAEVNERLRYIDEFLPLINNWSVCDSFCNTLKFTKNNMNAVWSFIQKYLGAAEEFKVRFCVVMMLDYYINDECIDDVILALDKVKHDGYYVKMAVAWAVSMCYVKFPHKTMEYLKNNSLDDFTYNKSLQKIIESLKVDKDTKIIIKNMKRK